MLQIKLSLDAKLIAYYCKKCGRLPGPEFYLYLVRDADKTVAAALFEVHSDRVYPVFYEDGGESAGGAPVFDAALRAGLNYAAGHGISVGCLTEDFREANERLFSKLNYPAQQSFDITNFFKKYKSCNLRW